MAGPITAGRLLRLIVLSVSLSTLVPQAGPSFRLDAARGVTGAIIAGSGTVLGSAFCGLDREFHE